MVREKYICPNKGTLLGLEKKGAMMDFAVSPPGGHHKKFRATGSMTSRAKMAKIGFSKAPSTKIKTRARIKAAVI